MRKSKRHLGGLCRPHHDDKRIAVVPDIHGYEQTQETLALLKILALGQQEVAEGKVVPLADAIERIKARRKTGQFGLALRWPS